MGSLPPPRPECPTPTLSPSRREMPRGRASERAAPARPLVFLHFLPRLFLVHLRLRLAESARAPPPPPSSHPASFSLRPRHPTATRPSVLSLLVITTNLSHINSTSGINSSPGTREPPGGRAEEKVITRTCPRVYYVHSSSRTRREKIVS